MGKVIVVTSGKGGVGKTTSSAALGAALAQNGEKVVVVDFDVGLRNLDLVMGAERRVVYDLVNVIQGEAKLTQALIRDKRVETLYLLPASQTRDKDNLTPEGVEKVIAALKNAFDVLYPEWSDKPVAFVGYGADGAVRAIEHWRTIVANARMVAVRAQVSLSLFHDIIVVGARENLDLVIEPFEIENGFVWLSPHVQADSYGI